MKLEQIGTNLEKRNIEYSLGQSATDVQVTQAEERLNIRFPIQIKQFYENCNGLKVTNPPLEIFRLDELNFSSSHFLHFATLHNQHQVCFDTSQLNEAEQWFIVSASDIYRITFTMASFWSNKIWR